MLRTLLQKARWIARDEAGISAVEYAILGALVAAGIAVAATALGDNVSAAIQNMADVVSGEGDTE